MNIIIIIDQCTLQNVAYLAIKSTRSQRVNRNVGASVSMATRNTFGIGIISI